MTKRDLNEAEARTRRAVISGAALAGASASALLLPQAADAAGDSIDGVATEISTIAHGETLVAKLVASGLELQPDPTEYVWVKEPSSDLAANRQNIRDAITEARTTGRAVHLRRGTYEVGATVDWEGATGDPSVVIRGFGDESLIATNVKGIRILSLSKVNGLTLEGFAVKGPGTERNNGQTGIRISTSSNVTIRDVSVSDSCGSGINLVGCTRSRVVACRVSRSWSDGIGVYGTPTANSQDISISGNFVFQAGDDSISVVRYASHVTEPDPGSPNYNAHHLRVQIQGNNVREGGANGIHVVGGRHVQVQGNIIDATRAVGILVDRDASFGTTASQIVQVHGNVVRRAGSVICPGSADAALNIPGAILVNNAQTASPVNRFGIFVSAGTIDSNLTFRTEDVSVVANDVHEPASRGIVIRGRSNGVVTGNTVRSAGSTGFDVAGDPDRHIQGLQFAQNRSFDAGGTGVLIKHVTSGAISGCVVTNSAAGSDNFRLEAVNGVTVRDNHSIDERTPPTIDRTFEFVGPSTDIVLSGNHERAIGKSSAFTGAVTGVRQAEPVVLSSGTPPVEVYAPGQLALETNSAVPQLHVHVGGSWRAVALPPQ